MNHNHLDFSNKCIIVTGATGSIGGAIFNEFYNHNAKILATSTSQEKLDKMFQNYEDKSRIFGLVVNMKDHSEVENLSKKANEIMNGLDVVICNAGITKDTLAMRMKTEDFKEVIDVNLISNFIYRCYVYYPSEAIFHHNFSSFTIYDKI